MSKDDPCRAMGWLENSRNSCYLDSLLYGLFYLDHPLIKASVLELDIKTIVYASPQTGVYIKLSEHKTLFHVVDQIQKSLQLIHKTITQGGSDVCTDLRSQIVQYVELRNNGPLPLIKMKLDWTGGQLEPRDVYILLEEIFGIPPVCKRHRITFLSNNLGQNLEAHPMTLSQTLSSNRSIMYDNIELITPRTIQSYLQDVIIKYNSPCNFIRSDDNRFVYQTQYQLDVIESTPILIVPLTRINIGQAGQQKITIPVIPSFQLATQSGSRLILKSIMVHRGGAGGGHYMAYLECGGKWYKYDDLNSDKKLIMIGDQSELIGSKEHYQFICENATDFIYVGTELP